MHYITNFFAILSGAIQQLINHNLRTFALILMAGIALAVILWLLCAFFGRLFYKPYRLSTGQHILCGLLAVLVIIMVPAYASAVYLQPSIAEKIVSWRDLLAHNKTWRDKLFKYEYYEIKKLGFEDFSSFPSPEQGGDTIPLHHEESIAKAGQIKADAAIDDFCLRFPLISKIMGANNGELANTLKLEAKNYLITHSDSDYTFENSIQFIADRINKELLPFLPRITHITRLGFIIMIIFCYTVCLIWIGYAALRKIRVHSPHSALSTHS